MTPLGNTLFMTGPTPLGLLITLIASGCAFWLLAVVASGWKIDLGVPRFIFVIGGMLVCVGLAAWLNYACAIIPVLVMTGMLAGHRLFLRDAVR